MAEKTWIRPVFAAALLAGCCAGGYWFVHSHEYQVRLAVGSLSPQRIVLSYFFAQAVMAAMLMSWVHVVRALGVHMTVRNARGIFPVAQLTKYVPGGVWPMVAQAALGRRAGLPAAAMGSAGVVNLALSIGVALLVSGLLVIEPSTAFAGWAWIAAAGGVVLLTALSPPATHCLKRHVVRTRWANRLGHLLPASGSEIARAVAWCLLAQLLCGIHLQLLIPGDGLGLTSVLYASAAYSLAAVAGVLVVLAPAGAGIREATLIVLLQPMASPAESFVVAVASRLILVVAELVLAATQSRQLRDVLLRTSR